MRIHWSVKTLLVPVVLLLGGASYQLLADWYDGHRFPRHGQLIKAGPIQLNLDCSGHGRHSVILDIGTGLAREWQLVQPEVAKFARVCSYDRAGSGWSEPAPEPRTSPQIASELKQVLDAAGEKGPYILVGHSIAGLHVRAFAGKFPEEVAGMVLVDGASEDDDRLKLPDALQKRQERQDMVNRIATPIEIHFGIERLLVAAGWADRRKIIEPNWDVDAFRLSPEAIEELFYLDRRAGHRYELERENAEFYESGRQIRALTTHTLGDKPLIVLTAGRPVPLPLLHDPLITAPEEGAKVWIDELQGALVQLSTHGRQIVVPDSDHMIPFERPDAVVSAIREVLASSAAL
jgi:pimeloyl-ACP methyl ester carboxylesterase